MHLRNRHIIDQITKKKRAFPLVGILGARQVGKSTLLRELIGKKGAIPYFTLDRPEVLMQLRSRTEDFILTETADFQSPIIIDEAHKAPQIFDVLKVLADEKKRRGIVTITGSVDFSQVAGVRETLTGRIGICRLYPLTVAEVWQHEFRTRWLKGRPEKNPQSEVRSQHIDAWLDRGGMPGICWLRDAAERESIIDEWLGSVCYRDLLQLKGARFDGALAREILTLVARAPQTSAAELATRLGVDARIVSKHLNGLEALFVVTRIKPLSSAGGTGGDRFYLLDAAVAAFLGAPRKVLYTVLMINEIVAQHEYAGLGRVELCYYASRGATKLDLAVKSKDSLHGFFIADRVEQSPGTMRSLGHLMKSGTYSKVSVLAPVTQSMKLGPNIVLEPYASYC